jgi:hypothetical protein
VVPVVVNPANGYNYAGQVHVSVISPSGRAKTAKKNLKIQAIPSSGQLHGQLLIDLILGEDWKIVSGETKVVTSETATVNSMIKSGINAVPFTQSVSSIIKAAGSVVTANGNLVNQLISVESGRVNQVTVGSANGTPMVINEATLALADWAIASGLGGPAIPTVSGAPAVQMVRRNKIDSARPMDFWDSGQAVINQLEAFYSSTQNGAASGAGNSVLQSWLGVGALGGVAGGIGGYLWGGTVGSVLIGAGLGAGAGLVITGLAGAGIAAGISWGLNYLYSGQASPSPAPSSPMSSIEYYNNNFASENQSFLGSMYGTNDDPVFNSIAQASDNFNQAFYGDQGDNGFVGTAYNNINYIDDYVASSPATTTDTAPWDDSSDTGWLDG